MEDGASAILLVGIIWAFTAWEIAKRIWPEPPEEDDKPEDQA